MNRIVVALGGDALGKTPQEQLQIIKNVAKPIVDLIEKGNEVIITHGYDPQVGMINYAVQTAAKSETNIPEMPLPECGAMTQGYMGYHIQNSITEELSRRGMNIHVVTVITQVVVDRTDEAFENPRKPIGNFYNEEDAKKLQQQKGYIIKEYPGRGWRRVVPSPKPVDIVEKHSVQSLVNRRHVVITVGGGGIPVVAEGNSLVGMTAVVDEYFASEKMAEILSADYFVMLTEIEKVPVNFGKPNEISLDKLNIQYAEKYIEGRCFEQDIILPKVEAALKFVKSKSGRKAIVGSIQNAKEAFNEKSGTIIEEK